MLKALGVLPGRGFVASLLLWGGGGIGARAEDILAMHSISTITDHGSCGTVETQWPEWRLAPMGYSS